MAPGEETLVEGIDREWLMEAARADPILHAWGVWDIDHEPGRVRFVSLRRDGRTVGYLLVWYGAETPRVHWISSDLSDGLLALGLPWPPVIAVVPERVVSGVQARLGPSERVPVDYMVCSGRALEPPDPRVRRLNGTDLRAIDAFVARNAEIRRLGFAPNPAQGILWGAFEADRLVAFAQVHVQLPAVWIVGSVYTDPEFRGRGLGRAVTTAATDATLAAGARAMLSVRVDNAPAQTIYREIGYQPVERRIFVRAGVGPLP